MGAVELQPHRRLVEYAVHQVQPPSAVYVTVDDDLVLRFQDIVPSSTIRVNTRLLLPDGRVQTGVHSIATSGIRTFLTLVVDLAEGWLLSAAVELAATGIAVGRVFATLSLRVGGATGFPAQELVAGYLSSVGVLSWPHGRHDTHLAGRGAYRTVTGTDPAAGAQSSETVPTGAVWRLLAWTAVLVTDATVSNRQGALLLDDGASVFASCVQGGAQSASQTITHSYMPGGNDAIEGFRINGPIPHECLIPQGYRIRTAMDGFQAGDNWGAPLMHVEEWMHP